jgi:alkylation response protein AidB-like acyl-CoA dehydrogenase
MEVALGSLDGARNGVGAQAVGIGRAALSDAVLYANERQAFGRPIAGFQAIQWMLADSWTELEASRALVWRAACLRDQGLAYGKASAMAKYYASEAANRICERAVQIYGGYGYSPDYRVERLYRDARVTTIYEGTSQIQKLVILRQTLDEWEKEGPAAAAGA